MPPATGPPLLPGADEPSTTRWIGRKAGALLALVATAVVGALASVNIDEIRSWMSEQDPLLSRLGGVEEAPGGFLLVAPDAAAVTPEMRRTTDCSRLWEQGVANGGVPVDTRRQQVVLRGQAKDGVEVIGMRAKVLSRGPAEGRAAIFCPSAGSVEPIGLSFDLFAYEGPPIEAAEAVRHDRDKPDEEVSQFRDGYLVRIQENEPISLMLQTNLPSDRITWLYELDVLVGGEQRTISIDDGGKPFYSPGYRRDMNEYDQGTKTGVEFDSWGVDGRAALVDDGGRQVLDYRGLRFDPGPGPVDVYQPPGRSGIDNGYRLLRVAGRPVATFNPPGVAPEAAPAPGTECGTPENYQRLDSVGPATTRSLDTRGTTVERVSQSAVCDGRAVRFEIARLPRTGSVVTAMVDETADPSLVNGLLDNIFESPDAAPPSWAPTVEPVGELPTDRLPAQATDDVVATDVGYLTEVFEDSRGTVVRFDKVDIRDGVTVNANPAVRTVVADGDVAIDKSVLALSAETGALMLLQRTDDGTLLAAIPAAPR